MTFVRTFSGAKPPARYDGIAFTVVLVDESPAATGPWTRIASLTLSPVDANPAAPAARDLTVSAATLETGWYRLIWQDPALNQYVSDPIAFRQSTPGSPSPTNLREWSNVKLVVAADEDDLQRWIDRAVRYVEQVTGRVPLTSTPDALATIVQEAVQLRVEQLALSGTAAATGAQVNPGGVISYSVPGYSQQISDPSKRAPRADVLNPWPALADLLWLLMTDERRAAWIAAMGGEDETAIALVPLHVEELE